MRVSHSALMWCLTILKWLLFGKYGGRLNYTAEANITLANITSPESELVRALKIKSTQWKYCVECPSDTYVAKSECLLQVSLLTLRPASASRHCCQWKQPPKCFFVYTLRCCLSKINSLAITSNMRLTNYNNVLSSQSIHDCLVLFHLVTKIDKQ